MVENETSNPGAFVMIEEQDVAAYLIGRGLLEPERVIRCDFRIENVSRRNRNYKVLSDAGPCLLLKQSADHGSAPGTLAHEAAAYLHLSRLIPRRERFFPSFHSFDAEANVLLLDLTLGSESLRQHQVETRHFSQILARTVGRALAALHGLRTDEPDTFAPSFEPSALSLIDPTPRVFLEISHANLTFYKIVQQYPAFRKHLLRVRRELTRSAIVHGDFKWDNCIVFARPGATRTTRLQLVDWEFAGRGDPAWDVGSVLCDYLLTWLMSIPVLDDAAPENWVDLADFPLESMRPAIGTFWEGYLRSTGMSGLAAELFLDRSIRCAALRLLQAAYEHLHEAMAITGNVYLFLQLSLNMLERPAEAGIHLLGLSAREVAA